MTRLVYMGGGAAMRNVLSVIVDSVWATHMAAERDEYTLEERKVLASLRKSSGRTCRNCEWYSQRGANRGCFPDGKYRKFLSASEFEAGCDSFKARSDTSD